MARTGNPFAGGAADPWLPRPPVPGAGAAGGEMGDRRALDGVTVREEASG